VCEYTVVVNDCDAPGVHGRIDVRTRATHYGNRNFVVGIDKVVDGLPQQLTASQQDWLHILLSVYAADLTCDRGTEQNWNRRINLHVAVREVDLWRSLAPQIEELFGDVTFDDLRLTFVLDRNPEEPPRQARRPFPSFDCVALFSGGADSFAGAADLIVCGRRPALLTHKSSGAINRVLPYLKDELAKLGAVGPNLALTARRHGITGNLGNEGSQRSRSLLFLGFAAVVAAASRVEDVFINENGVMAVHVPMTAARMGSYSTRTASPTMLDSFGSLATRALGAPISVRNLYQSMTKPEVVAHTGKLGVAHAMANTISCWSIGRHPTHCGYCAPCLIRRVSFEHGGLMDAIYGSNPFNGDRPSDPVAQDNLIQLLILATDLSTSDPALLELDYAELLNTGRSLSLADSIAMHQRWGRQVLAVAANYAYSTRLIR
jgi:Queuosine biosynthesis protein QueC